MIDHPLMQPATIYFCIFAQPLCISLFKYLSWICTSNKNTNLKTINFHFSVIFCNLPQFAPPSRFLKGEGVNFNYHPQRGWKYGVGAGVLKGGGVTLFLFNFSKVHRFTFRNYCTLSKVVLCIRRKILFFCHHNFMKKGYSKQSKNEPENIT